MDVVRASVVAAAVAQKNAEMAGWRALQSAEGEVEEGGRDRGGGGAVLCTALRVAVEVRGPTLTPTGRPPKPPTRSRLRGPRSEPLWTTGPRPVDDLGGGA